MISDIVSYKDFFAIVWLKVLQLAIQTDWSSFANLYEIDVFAVMFLLSNSILFEERNSLIKLVDQSISNCGYSGIE